MHIKLDFAKLMRPEVIGSILILSFGIVFLLIIRPLQTPDEANSFARAYQIAEGKVFIGKNNGQACYISGSGPTYVSNALLSTDLPKSVTNFVNLNRNDYSIRLQLKDKLNPAVETRECGSQFQTYSPVGFLPQALAIEILRIFNAPPILMDYLARLFVLIVWAILIALAIKIIPVRKWTFLGIALLPIAIQQSISISADVLSIAPVALTMAILVRSYYENRKRKYKKDLILMSFLIAVATLAKPVMVIMIILLPFYKIHKSNKDTHQYLLRVSAALVPIILYFLWDILASAHNASTSDILPLAAQKTPLFKSEPLTMIKSFIIETYHFLFYGAAFNEYASFGWFNDTGSPILPITWNYIGIAVLGIYLLVSYDEKSKVLKDTTKNAISRFNIAAVITATGIVLADIFALFIIWTPLNDFTVEGIQFRYYLAAFFVIGSIFETKYLRSSERWYRNFVIINSLLFFILSVLTITKVFPVHGPVTILSSLIK